MDYAARHWLSGWWLNLRRLAFVVVVLSLMVVLAGFVPAVRFQTAAGYEHAGYAARVNGRLEAEDGRRVREETGLTVAAVTQATTSVVGRTTAPVDLYLGTRAADQSHTWFTDALLVAGRAVVAGHDDEVALDAGSARRLGVHAGSVVELVSPFERNRRFTATITGLYASSGPTRGAAFVGPGRFGRHVRAHLAASSPAGGASVYSDLFVGAPGRHEAAVVSQVQERLGGDPELLVEGRAAQAAQARRTSGELLGPIAGWAIPVVAAFVLITVLLREQAHRLKRRRREVGLLVGFGLAPASVRRLVVGETVAEAAIGGLLAIPIGLWLLRERFWLYLPRTAVGAMRMDLLLVVAALAALGSLQVSWLLHRLALTELIEGDR